MKSLRMRLAPVRQPVGQQGGLAAARFAEQHQRAAVACRVAIERLEVIRSADVGAAAGFGEGLVVAGLAGERVGNALDRELRLDGGLQVFEDERGQLDAGQGSSRGAGCCFAAQVVLDQLS